MNKLTAVLAVSIILIALVLGSLDLRTFGGSTSILNPATAIATVVAFVALVLYEEDSGKLHRELLKASLIAAVVLDAAKIVSLTLLPPRYRMEITWFVLGFIEKKKIELFATQPFTIGPKPFTAESLAIDPVPLLLLGYYFMVCRRKAKKPQK